ncbi:MAG: endonuclease, partial [Bacteroidota bacterium]|nr:endonuclease [Bacteroidota bacterium]
MINNFTTYIKTALTIFFCFLIADGIYSQAGTYYNFISASAPSFVADLESRLRSPYTRISYDNFDETNIANFASIDNGNGTKSVFCVYSGYQYIYTGTFTWGTMSREHTWAHSWSPTFPSTSTDQYADQHHLFPTHQNNANGRRSNHPLGIVANITYQFLDGKVGTNINGDIVYEPGDSHKGDAARALLYMSVRYDGISGYRWTFNWLNNTKLPSLSEGPQDINLLIAWNNQDPPDKYEVDRNNYVQSIQQNRNPFVDHPEYVNYIDFNDLSKLNPTYATEPAGHVSGIASAPGPASVQVSWNDATGAQLPSGYLLVAYSSNDYFLPIDGASYLNDTNLADGYALLN